MHVFRHGCVAQQSVLNRCGSSHHTQNTYMHAHAHAHAHAHTHTHTDTHTHTQTHTHTYTQTHPHKNTHTYNHTHTNTHHCLTVTGHLCKFTGRWSVVWGLSLLREK